MTQAILDAWKRIPGKPNTENERLICECLKDGEKTVRQLRECTGIDPNQLTSVLVYMRGYKTNRLPVIDCYGPDKRKKYYLIGKENESTIHRSNEAQKGTTKTGKGNMA